MARPSVTQQDPHPIPDFDGCHAVTRISSGPIADLYSAVQRPLGRRVLIKALSSSILPSSPFAATLEREARLLAEVDHPNVLHLYDFVRTGERMWLVLEHVEGHSLDELLARVGRLSPPAAAAIALEIARALDHAHGLGIVHRDVQPRNVLVSERGQVKLMSFAIAVDERMPTAPELLDGATAATGPAYMSPEQILGEPADPRSDLFSLGVVLYELLAGKPPFAGPDDRTTTQRIRHDAPPPLGRSVPNLPASLERAVLHCLEKLPGDRFHSAGELVTVLRRVIDDLAVTNLREVIAEELLRARLGHGPSGEVEDAPVSLATPAGPRFSTAAAGLGLVVCATLAVLGGIAIEYADRPVRQVRSSPRLELVPAAAGSLRVVAEPWAHVVVDGQRVETTPFARPIPLAAGTHYVRLEHPNAPPELRTVRLAAGETIQLDVRLAVVAPAPSGSGSGSPTPATSAPDSP